MDQKRPLTTQTGSAKRMSAGICVLAVDDDMTCLKIVEVMLRAFQYEVVTVKDALDALAILRERQRGFDIVLTDLHMPVMDGLALLEQVEIEFKIPVVMMSADDKEIVASRCLASGASFYLTKPLAKSDLSNLWQYVYLKRHNETMVISEQIGSDSKPPTPKKVSKEDSTDCTSSVNESNWRQESKKKSSTKKDRNEGENKYDNAAQKKSRVVWNNGLHNKFLDAIDQIGLHRAVPKKILELMNVPRLSRENVASHLQKYRMFLKRFDEASRASEASVLRSLAVGGALKPSFAFGHPSLLLNMERGFSHISEQQRVRKSFEPRQGSCSSSQRRHENCKPKCNHRKLKQPSINDGNYSSLQMEPPNIRTGSSSSYAVLTSPATGTDRLQMIHQQVQARSGRFDRGSLDDHSFNTTSMPSFNNFNFNQAPSFNYTNDGFAGYSRMGEIRDGKMPVVDTVKSPLIPGITSSHSDYAAQGFASSSGLMPLVSAPSGGFMPQALASSGRFATSNPFSAILTDVSQEPPLVPPPPQLQQQQQQNDIEVREEVDRLFESMKHNSPFGNISSPVSFDDDCIINEMLLEPVDQSPNQQ